MASKEEIIDVLREINDPELDESLVELDMVKEIEIAGGAVDITVALTVQGCPLKDTIINDVVGAVEPLEGVDEVSVELTTMTDEQRRAVVEKVRGSRKPKSRGDKEHSSPLLQPDSPTEVIAVASGKGGVGKSTATINLAHALLQEGYSVAIMDCDIYGSSIPNMLDADRRPVVIEKMVLPVEVRGIKIISMSFFTKENQPVIWRGPMLGKALNQFFNDVHWGEPDFMLLDLPPGTGDVALDVHELLPASREIIVTTPQETAVHVAYRAGRMAQNTNHEVLGVIENMSFFESEGSGRREYIFGKGGGRQLCEDLEVPLLGEVPLENRRIGNTELFADETEAAGVFRSMARRVAEQTERKEVVH